MIKNEEWRDIKGWEGQYLVSNLGNVKTLIGYRCEKGRIMKLHTKKEGYLTVGLKIAYKKQKQCYVHRLVAEAFIPNPDNLPEVNHKDEDKTNNRVDNLEWCTAKYNMNYGTAKNRRAEKFSIAVNQYSKDGVFIKQWKSMADASRELRITTSHICNVCQGKRKSAGGFIWRYA